MGNFNKTSVIKIYSPDRVMLRFLSHTKLKCDVLYCNYIHHNKALLFLASIGRL